MLLVALHLAKAAAFIAAGQAPLEGDALVYWSLGERVAAGNWLLLDNPPEVTRTPAYPYYVAFQATCSKRASAAAAIVMQHLMLLVNVALAAWTCWLLTGKRGSIAACLGLSLACFSCFGVGMHLLSDTLLTFLLDARHCAHDGMASAAVALAGRGGGQQSRLGDNPHQAGCAVLARTDRVRPDALWLAR